MSAPVDVLAVMDAEIESLPLMATLATREGLTMDASGAVAILTEARAAVAELIDMAQIADDTLNEHGIGLSRGDGLTLRAALARCTGETK